MKITLTDTDIIFHGFKGENRPAEQEEAEGMLRHFYAKAFKIIQSHKKRGTK